MCFRLPFSALDADKRQKIFDLCVLRMTPTDYERVPPTYYCFNINKDKQHISVPLGLWHQFYASPPNDNLNYPRTSVVFRGTLYRVESDPLRYRDQEKVALDARAALDESRVCFLNLATGFGKTITAVHLSSVYGLKTLVLCHFRVVIGQWEAAFKKFTSARVQNLNEDSKLHVADNDVFVSGIKRCIKLLEKDTECFNGIGFLIVDEAHVATGAAFTRCLPFLPPMRYLIALTATPERSDKLDILLRPYFGSPKNFLVRQHKKKFEVIKFHTPFEPDIEFLVRKGKTILNWSHLQNSLAYHKERNQLVADVALAYSHRRILILCGRIAQATAIFKTLADQGEATALFIGATKTYERNTRILVASAKKAGVGFDDPRFNMLVLTMDVKDVRQFEGRIRCHRNVLVDFTDKHSTLEKHWKLRKKWYLKRGARIFCVSSLTELKVLAEENKIGILH